MKQHDEEAEYVLMLHAWKRADTFNRGFLHLSNGAVTQQVPGGAQLVEVPQNPAIANNHSLLVEHVCTAKRHPSGTGLVVTLKDATLPRYLVSDENRFWSRVKQRWFRLVLGTNGDVIWEEL
ncbi:unnamed protein product [Aspergillus oryzae RIB40]|uniref:DNA, SC020 n=2 Tax=Aspergillus oryzae TaxID=5062 RepID=Q2U4R9_ASPOR|nr:unnamed protein product [Aspergillus oryzae RIB40]EIT72338.1 hypothetical protein Ao3042_01435 [Aspergillus oryzae 3.042]KDE75208.1 hypothetical protein AO1008_11450 [Aspergillus oryzae 100-8]BAE63446.1 unnamed protein product [Aspergillus oryzae RIB40]|eukprot:EIT72338.1 hypothetical protein Ao3042_01435 [Aspergillus oryzae 3.042]